MYKQFGLWIEEQAGAQCRQGKGRTDCVINIKHIEPGRFAALYVVDSPTGLGRAVHILEGLPGFCFAGESVGQLHHQQGIHLTDFIDHHPFYTILAHKGINVRMGGWLNSY